MGSRCRRCSRSARVRGPRGGKSRARRTRGLLPGGAWSASGQLGPPHTSPPRPSPHTSAALAGVPVRARGVGLPLQGSRQGPDLRRVLRTVRPQRGLHEAGLQQPGDGARVRSKRQNPSRFDVNCFIPNRTVSAAARAAPSTPRLVSGLRRSRRPGGLGPAAHVPSRRLRLMRLPNLTRLDVRRCHYGAVVHPA